MIKTDKLPGWTICENTVKKVVNTELAYAQNLPAIFYEGERPRSFAPPFLLTQKIQENQAKLLTSILGNTIINI